MRSMHTLSILYCIAWRKLNSGEDNTQLIGCECEFGGAMEGIGDRGKKDSRGFIIEPQQVKKAKEAIDFLSSIGGVSGEPVQNLEDESASSSEGE